MNINLYGMDIIKKTDSKEIFIIDLNNFPSFKGVKELPELMTKLFISLINK